MSEETSPSATESAASSAVSDALANGQSQSLGNMSLQKTPAQAAYDILQREREDRARRAGRRPLFRGINLGGMA